jgi:putative IMPACT (imprinted ancient) family translation regulator
MVGLPADVYSITVNKSRFYAVVAPVDSQQALDELIAARKIAVKKARHHCWAARF